MLWDVTNVADRPKAAAHWKIASRKQPLRRWPCTVVGHTTSVARMPERASINFCTSRDGTRLAVASVGDGPPVVVVTLHEGGDKLDAPTFASRHLEQAFAEHVRHVRYDARGCGMSDREVHRLDFEAFEEDLDAVVSALGTDSVMLFGVSHGGSLAVRYAASHPDRIGRVMLYGTYARGRRRRQDMAQAKEAQAILDAIEVAFDDLPYSATFRRAFSSQYWPSATPAQLDIAESFNVGRMTGEVAAAYTVACFDIDVSDQAAQLRCPVLVLHARGDRIVPFDEGRRLAALIPGARFVPIEGASHVPLETDAAWPLVAKEMVAFLRPDLAVSASQPRQRAVALTSRQAQVLRLVSKGQTDKQIARALSLSPRTVEMHVAAAMKALGSRTRAEATHLASQQGLLPPD